jgi:aminopeptidase N
MVRDGELATRRFVRLVLEHAAAEPDDSVLERLLGQALAALDVYGEPANRSSARSSLHERARAELAAAEAGSDRQLAWARHVISSAESEADLAFVRRLLDGAEDLPGLTVDTDLRWQIVGTLARRGADDDGVLIDAELKNDPTDIGARRAAGCRAARPAAEAKQAAWHRLEAGEGSLAEQRAVAGGFGPWGQEDLVRPYVEPYFESLGRWWAERTREEALLRIGGLYPGTLVEDATVEATQAALADSSLPGPVRRLLLEAEDGVRRALRARAADRD